jgi:glycerol kinase
VVTGGLAAVDPLLQRLSDLSGVVVQRAEVREATSTGLAFLLAGLPENWPDVAADQTFEPTSDTKLQRRFDAWLERMPPI